MIFDSNLLIISARVEMQSLREWFIEYEPGYSSLSRVEILGFQNLREEDKHYFESILNQYKKHPVDDNVLDQAVLLRQKNKYKLGDAIIAATALVTDQELATNDLTDFVGIPGLRVVYPLLTLYPTNTTPPEGSP